MQYWTAISLANASRIDEALPLFRIIFNADEKWRLLTRRLPRAGLFPVPEQTLQIILDAK